MFIDSVLSNSSGRLRIFWTKVSSWIRNLIGRFACRRKTTRDYSLWCLIRLTNMISTSLNYGVFLVKISKSGVSFIRQWVNLEYMTWVCRPSQMETTARFKQRKNLSIFTHVSQHSKKHYTWSIFAINAFKSRFFNLKSVALSSETIKYLIFDNTWYLTDGWY